MIEILKGLPQYDQENRNGINSKARDGNPEGKAITFIKLKDDKGSSSDDVFAGMKVDLFDTKAGIWVPGIVDKVNKISSKDVSIIAFKEGLSKEIFNVKG